MDINKVIIITILNVLYQCDGHMIPEKTLFIQVNIELDGMAVGTSELKEHLNHCADKGWAEFKTDQIDRSRKWFITDDGKVVRS